VNAVNLRDKFDHKSCMGNFSVLTQTPDHMNSYWKHWVSTIFHREMVNVIAPLFFRPDWFLL